VHGRRCGFHHWVLRTMITPRRMPWNDWTMVLDDERDTRAVAHTIVQ
jgi:hypothetical protein